MPKIVINEYDLTKAGTGEYSNFSVVVPGFVGEGYNASVFDENGVYECSSQADFVKNVGKVAAEMVSRLENAAATAPTILAKIAYDPNQVDEVYPTTDKNTGTINITYNKASTYKNMIQYLVTGEADKNGKTGLEILNTVLSEDSKITDTQSAYGVYYTVTNTTGDSGVLADYNYRYIEVDAKSTTSNIATMPTVENGTMDINSTFSVDYNEYYIIYDSAQGNAGSWIEDRTSHYGNQMAYELLGLGYTVLYKQMNRLTKTDLNKLMQEINKAGNDNAKIAEIAEKKKSTVNGGDYYVVATSKSAVNVLDNADFWECLRDKSTYDFRYLVTGLLTKNDQANKQIQSIAAQDSEVALDDADILKDGRGDCVALIDIDSAAYEGLTQSEAIPKIAKEAATFASAYCAVFAPYVTYIMAEDSAYNNNATFPASFHYLACAANSKNNNYNEWYANAGYTRGVSAYTITTTGCKFGEMAIQALEPRFTLKVGQELAVNKDGTVKEPKCYEAINTTVAVNLIVKIKDSYFLWGNRTCKKLGTRGASDGDLVAQHFLNIRQLCSTIKKQTYVACRRVTFDPNSDTLWTNFVALLRPMLEKMKADQGVRDYKIIKDTTDRKALLKARIRIVPIEAVEDFEIGLYLEDSLSEVAVTEA